MTGLVLAGGRSSRFGSDKTRAVLAGTGADLLHRTLDILQEVEGVGALAVSCRGDQVEEFRRRVPGGVRIIPDPPHDGEWFPMHGLMAGLACSPDAVLVLPCDLPLMTAETLGVLARAREACLAGGCEGSRMDLLRTLFVHADGTGEPLVAVYEQAALPFLAAAAAAGRMGMYGAVPADRQLAVPCPSDKPFLNMNRPADKLRAEQKLGE